LFAIWQGDEPHPFHEKKPIHLGCAHNLAELAHAEKRDKRHEHNNSGAKNHLKTNHVGFIPAPRGMGPEFVLDGLLKQIEDHKKHGEQSRLEQHWPYQRLFLKPFSEPISSATNKIFAKANALRIARL
jgi:hypothetical protein